ncbi:MAG: hypothetical protein M3R18_04330, partial [Pseudomonadota bacterium]|nr:hypothetical protein [Pseudomonadota bacterium]
MLVGSGILLLGALWIAGHAMTLMPSLALSSTPVSPTATTLPAPTTQVAQKNPAAPVTETPIAATSNDSAPALAAGSQTMAE